jgi:NAD(P)-dependent dehydrogenase (short-subunit alcohol dehydrogenase family)
MLPSAIETKNESVIARVPLGRLAAPKGLAGPALYLVSNRGSYLTGVNLPVGRGATTTF